MRASLGALFVLAKGFLPDAAAVVFGSTTLLAPNESYSPPFDKLARYF